jgi:ribosomal protein S20
VNELEDKLRSLLDEFVSEITEVAKADLRNFGRDMAKDFATYLYRSHAADDAAAKENLRDLRLQAEHLLVKHAIRTNQAARKRLMSALKIVAQIALQALRVQLPLP